MRDKYVGTIGYFSGGYKNPAVDVLFVFPAFL